jgi:alanyl-tRNA synthetase
VGDLSHHTFFEMLGNFSVGDYFKEEVIPWSWQFCTEVLGIPEDRLWITIFTDDDEAYEIWRRLGRPDERILRYGEDEGNFWASGDTGPCGPCSELHYDYGEQYGCGPECEPKHDCGRFLEIWNLVFMTYDRQEDGSLIPLPLKNIDTGAGLERVSMAVQGVRSSYETTGLRALLDEASVLADRHYGDDEEADRALRAIVDHSRALTFLIADGVLPSNEGRGYVLRRVLRRAVYFGRVLRMPAGFMETMTGHVIDQFRDSYSERIRGKFLVEPPRLHAVSGSLPALHAAPRRQCAAIASQHGRPLAQCVFYSSRGGATRLDRLRAVSRRGIARRGGRSGLAHDPGLGRHISNADLR